LGQGAQVVAAEAAAGQVRPSDPAQMIRFPMALNCAANHHAAVPAVPGAAARWL
jgi:hypothetical protein